MGKSSTTSSDILKLYYNGTAIANLADNAATSPFTNIYVALHTADPTAAGTQSSSEVSYTGYARVAVPRTTGGWTVTGTSASPVANIVFGACTAGSATATYFSTGIAVSGATKILHSGPISPSISISTGTTPQLTTATTITES